VMTPSITTYQATRRVKKPPPGGYPQWGPRQFLKKNSPFSSHDIVFDWRSAGKDSNMRPYGLGNIRNKTKNVVDAACPPQRPIPGHLLPSVHPSKSLISFRFGITVCFSSNHRPPGFHSPIFSVCKA